MHVKESAFSTAAFILQMFANVLKIIIDMICFSRFYIFDCALKSIFISLALNIPSIVMLVKDFEIQSFGNLWAQCTRFLTVMKLLNWMPDVCLFLLCSLIFALKHAHFQASQVSIELVEKSNRLVELEDVLSTRDKEIKELHSKLHEVVCMLPVHGCSMTIALFIPPFYSVYEIHAFVSCAFFKAL